MQQFQSARRVANFVTEIIRPAAIRVDVVEILVQRFGEKPGYDVEIFVVMRCEPPRVSPSHFGRAAGLWCVPGNVDFAGE